MDTQLLAQEREIGCKAEQSLAELRPSTSLSEASEQTSIPLSTLADVVRAGRVPASKLLVEDRRLKTL